MRNRFRQNGYIFTVTRAKKHFECRVCPLPILPGADYLKIEKGGGGVSWSVHPDRIHNNEHDIELYLKRVSAES